MRLSSISSQAENISNHIIGCVRALTDSLVSILFFTMIATGTLILLPVLIILKPAAKRNSSEKQLKPTASTS